MKRFTLTLAFSLLLAACSFAAEGSISVLNQCSDDSDCPGARCDRAADMCVARMPATFRVALEVAAPAVGIMGTPGLVASEPFTLDGAAERTMQFPRTVTAFGRVRGPAGERVAAEITFVAPAAFPGGRVVRFTRATAPSPYTLTQFGSVEADYQVQLPAGTYGVDVQPAGDFAGTLPPLHFDGVTFDPAADGAALELIYGADRLSELRGVVEAPSGAGRGGLQIQALDRATGRVVSSSAVTSDGSMGAPAGSFSILIDVGALESYVLRIRSSAGEALVPTFTVDPRYLFPDMGGVAHILVPDVASAVCYRGAVEADLPDHMRALAGNTVLSFRSTVIMDAATGVVGTVESTVTADAGGHFEASLLPGTYDIVLTPVGRSDAAVLAPDPVTISPPMGTDCLMGQTFVLPQRATLGGQVRTPDGRTMEGATVQALALNREATGRAFAGGRFNRSSEAVTDPTGRFGLRLDLGSYDIVVKPPTDSGFPWSIATGQEFGAVGAVLARDFEFAAPVALAGTVLDESGAPVAAAEVAAFGIVEDAGGIRSVPIGRAVTDTNGRYTVLLPPTL